MGVTPDDPDAFQAYFADRDLVDLEKLEKDEGIQMTAMINLMQQAGIEVSLLKADRNTEAGKMPDEQLLAAMGKYNEELIKAGVMMAGDGLKPSSTGKRMRFGGGPRTIVDGPFTETKELVAGYWIWNVKSMDEAVDWLRRCPDPMPGEESEIEIRPLYEMDDFSAK